MKRSVLCIFMIAFFVLFSSCGNSGRKHKKEKTVEKTSIVNKKKFWLYKTVNKIINQKDLI